MSPLPKKGFLSRGLKRIHHFYHEAHVDCSFVGEPETQEHRAGGLSIQNRVTSEHIPVYIFHSCFTV
ncbi:competence protein CoiA family protein [Solibacillus isronensis]|uniref:competence protein CoiA family protein n=1 Tax=Solibacillus isronensis TaxID=412383 RepID=UPI00333F9562